MEAIKRLDAPGALAAFETALRMDNEVGLRMVDGGWEVGWTG